MLQLIDWLTAFPGFADICFSREQLLPGHGHGGIFYKGCRELSRQEDILGAQTRRQRLTLGIAVHWSGADFTTRLEALARWVTAGAPALGQAQTVRLDGGRLTADDGTRIARYEADLVVEYNEILR